MTHEWWSRAGGEGAVSVAEDQGGPDGGGDEAVEAAEVEDLAVGAEDGGDEFGVTGEPAQDFGWEFGAVGGGADPGCLQVALEGLLVEGDEQSGGGAVGLRRQAGVERVVGGGDQGVPEPGAVVAAVEAFLPGPQVGRWVGLRVGGWIGAGQGQECGQEEGAVLGRPAALQADSAGAVRADREVAGQVRGAFLAFQGGLEPAVDAVGVDHLDQVPPRPRELGGIEASWPDAAAPSPRDGGPGHRTAGPGPTGRSHRPVPGIPPRRPDPASFGSADRSTPWPGPLGVCPRRGRVRRRG